MKVRRVKSKDTRSLAVYEGKIIQFNGTENDLFRQLVTTDRPIQVAFGTQATSKLENYLFKVDKKTGKGTLHLIES